MALQRVMPIAIALALRGELSSIKRYPIRVEEETPKT